MQIGYHSSVKHLPFMTYRASSRKVVVPLRGHAATDVVITESGQDLWSSGRFVGGDVPGVKSGVVDEGGEGIEFTLVQGSYALVLLAQVPPKYTV